jgi:hypothetical protein
LRVCRLESPLRGADLDIDKFIFLCVGGIWSIIFAIGIAVLTRRRGVIDLRLSNAVAVSQELIQKIHSGRDACAGTYVLRCPDSEWQLVVLEFLKKADCVVVDVTVPSDNVLWEIKLASLVVPPDQLVLAHGVWADGDPSLPEATAERLKTFSAPEMLSGCTYLAYSRGVRPEVTQSVAFKRTLWLLWMTRVIVFSLLCADIVFLQYFQLEGRMQMGFIVLLANLPLIWLLPRLMQRLLKRYVTWNTAQSATVLKTAVTQAIGKARGLSADAVRRRRRRAALTGMLVSVVFYTIVFTVRFSGSVRNRSTLHDLIDLLLDGCLPLALFVGFWTSFRRADGVVLWLRRFHQRELKKARFGWLLFNVCWGIAKPITIQDSTYRTSWYTGFFRDAAYLPLAVFIWFIGFVVTVYCAELISGRL